MDYNHISSFLDRFKKILFQKGEIYQIVAKTISEKTSFPVDINLIKIKNTTIYIQGSPIFKNEILIHKDEIISTLKKNFPEYRLVDIK